MNVVTAWVKLAPVIGGQDHLGTQAPCTSIYVAQLPGLTNTTARVRYYSFYLWFLCEFESRFPNASTDDLVLYLRRAECLLALIAIRHGRKLATAETLHGSTMVGREVLVPASLQLEDGPILLSTFATQDSSKREQYLQNHLGGLGQYYLGALRELGLLGGSTRTRDIKYTPERGRPLAKVFGARAEGNAFFELLVRDEVQLADLDALSSFCPCGLLPSEEERQQLIDLLFDPQNKLGHEADARRSTLTLLLDLASKQQAGESWFEREFRASAYTNALRDGTPWEPAEKLRPCLHAWSVYSRNELLSIAFQGLFWAALNVALQKGRFHFADTTSFTSFVLQSVRSSVLDGYPAGTTFLEAVNHARETAPPLSEWAHEAHEIKTGFDIIEQAKDHPHGMQEVFRKAVSILLTLCARDSGDDAYAKLHFEPSYFERYPINLRSFLHRSRTEWGALPLDEVLERWILWTVRTHWRVALHKLAASNPRDTFKIRLLDDTIRVVEAPLPVFTAPRIHRAISILRDLGLFHEDDSRRPSLTTDGVDLLEVLRA